MVQEAITHQPQLLLWLEYLANEKLKFKWLVKVMIKLILFMEGYGTQVLSLEAQILLW